MRSELYPDGVWSFIVRSEAWPTLPSGRVVDEVAISLDAEGGGTYGEFGIEFVDLGESNPSQAKLRAYFDSWPVVAESGIVGHLAALGEGKNITVARLRALLLALGYRDRTAEYRDKIAACEGPSS